MLNRIKIGLVISFSIAISACSHLPTKLVARAMNNQETADNLKYLKQYTQTHLSQPIQVDQDIAYGQLPSQKLDVIYPEKIDHALPVVFWVHGGGWVSGRKQDSLDYVKLLSDRGFFVVNIEYTRVPTAKFPQQIIEINQAVEYILQHQHQWKMDTQKVFFAGDSAGANLVTTYVALITNPEFSNISNIQSPISIQQVKRMILHSGVYDLNALYTETQNSSLGLIRWTARGVISDFSGEQSPSQMILKKMSVLPWVNHHYPPIFLTASENDALTQKQSIPFIHRLKENGVGVEAYIYPKDYPEKLNHDFNFNLRLQVSQEVIENSVKFLLNKSS